MLFNIIIPTLAPIFLMIALGWGMRTSKWFPNTFFAGANSLAFYIGLPALLVVGIATAPLQFGPALRILYVLIAATTIITLLAYVCTRWMHMAPPTGASFIQASMRGNLAYIGLPILLFATESTIGDYPDAAALQAAMMLVLAPSVPLYNIACIIILAHGASRGNSGRRPKNSAILLKVLQNPLLIACALGLFLSLTGIGLPLTIVRTLRPLGQMALPLALFSIGASFAQGKLLERLGPVTWIAAILKVALLPAVGALFTYLFAMNPVEARMALIFLACPTAVSSFVMAEQMGADAELAGSTVLLSTLLAMPAMAMVLALT